MSEIASDWPPSSGHTSQCGFKKHIFKSNNKKTKKTYLNSIIKQLINTCKNIEKLVTNYEKLYAQTSIVVVLIVVNIFGFLVITRDHRGFGGCH